jgi:hypothetical protein
LEYNGKDEPSQWLYRRNNFFASQHTKPDEQMHLVAFHLRGDALTWFIRWEKEIGQFSAAIDRPFGPCLHHNHLGDLTNTMQSRDLENYANQFLLIVNKIPALSNNQQVMLYTTRLQRTLQIDIRLQQPPDLESAIALARKF